MKEKLYTIELIDAVKSDEECPFCYLERKLEQDAIQFALGVSYMEQDIREETSRQGFCRHHTKKMFDYGNQLGNAWILKSRMQYLSRGMKSKMEGYVPSKVSFLDRMKRQKESGSDLSALIREEEAHCYICAKVETTYERMVDTFAYLIKTDSEFLGLLQHSKGFCIHHFADILDVCEKKLNEQERMTVIPLLFSQMTENLDRIQEDINWFIEKYDYCNKNADWKTSKDAVPRTMQKIIGGYPADPVFKKLD